MISLKNKYLNKSALLISGGPSAVNLLPELKSLDRERFIVFLESKALTKSYVRHGVEPDFYLLPYPEKSKDNYFGNIVYQSLKVDVPIKRFIKTKYHDEVDYIIQRKDVLFEPWSNKSLSKKYKYKKNTFLKDSPFSLISSFPNMKIITRKASFEDHFSGYKFQNKFHYFYFNQEEKQQSFINYINIHEMEDKCYINQNSFTNSAAISTFPIIKYLGLKDVYLLGFDGTMLGVFEYNADKIFKSKLHFYLFLFLCRHAFSHNYKINIPMYLRPKNDLTDFDLLLDEFEFNVYRIIDRSYKKIANFKNTIECSMAKILNR